MAVEGQRGVNRPRNVAAPTKPSHVRRPRLAIVTVMDGATKYSLLALIAIAAVFPLFWMLMSSLKTPPEMSSAPPTWIPAMPNLDAYATAFRILPFSRALLNSVLIAGGDTLAILLTSIMAGYVFAKYQFRGRDTLFLLLLGTMFVPPIVTLVPLYHVLQSLGLLDTYVGVMIPQFANAFGIFLMRQFIHGVPDELIDAARIDGASEWTVLWRVVTPLLAPAAATLGLFAFVYQWNNFLWPLTVLQSPERFTFVLELSRLLGYTSSIRLQNVLMAGAVVSALPGFIIFVWLQRFFVAGMAESALKG